MIGFIKRLFCTHDYFLINQFEMKSEIEQIKEIGLTPNTHHSAKRIKVSDFTCGKCGTLKRKTIKTA